MPLTTMPLPNASPTTSYALEGDTSFASPARNVPTIPAPPPVNVMRFHVGIRPGGPAWFHNIYGICFPQTSSLFDDDGTEHRKVGAVAELDLEQLRQVRDGIKNRVVRWARAKDKAGVERKFNGEIWDRNTTGFRPQALDEPLAPYLIFERMKEESVQPDVADHIFHDLEDAISSAEKSEAKNLADPRDAKTRAKHADLKATGKTLSSRDEPSV